MWLSGARRSLDQVRGRQVIALLTASTVHDHLGAVNRRVDANVLHEVTDHVFDPVGWGLQVAAEDADIVTRVPQPFHDLATECARAAGYQDG
jgi:hypothetical protein